MTDKPRATDPHTQLERQSTSPAANQNVRGQIKAGPSTYNLGVGWGGGVA